MYKRIFLSTLILINSGCFTNIEDKPKISKLIKRDDIYYMALQNTKKGEIVASFETKGLLIATYLNPIFNGRDCSICFNTDDGRYFLLGLLINGERDSRFDREGYSIDLNGLEPIELRKVDRYDPLLKEMPMVNNWCSYYIAKFPKQSGDRVLLNFKSDRFGEDSLEF